MASSDVASNPLVPKDERAASSTRARVPPDGPVAAIYQMVDNLPMIREGLAGKRIAITGTTGFLGTALLERLVRTVPDADLVLLLRAGRRSTVAQRANREIFRNDAFDVLREQLGGQPGLDEVL